MPLFYDLNRATSTNASANTSTTHLWGLTVAEQETVGIYGFFAASRFATAGGAQLNVATNAGTVASGGTSQTPAAKNQRYGVAAQSTWKNDASAITPGTTLTPRITVGFAQTGGTGGYVPIVPQAAIQMQPNGANPVDIEFSSDAASASVPFNLSVDIGEGI
jgi:hypothetical protein